MNVEVETAHGRLAVYEWNDWEGYLAAHLFHDSVRIRAELADRSRDVLQRLPPDCGSLLFHLDCSQTARFPEKRVELIHALRDRGIRPINELVEDITKPFIQRLCQQLGLPTTALSGDVPPMTRVIVKTALNHGGEPEATLSPYQRARLGLPPVSQVVRNALDYRVSTWAEVPKRWLGDPALQIERFVSNRQNRWFRAFVWLDRLCLVEAINPHPIKKMTTNSARHDHNFLLRAGRYISSDGAQDVDETLLKTLASVVSAMKLEFGTIDAVCSDDPVYYVVDVNTTPYWRVPHSPTIAHLRGAALTPRAR
ncbi:MAG: hypothetical protein ACJ8ER_15765 [Allosphingosinicella sp.]